MTKEGGDCIFFIQMMETYGFDVEVERCGFCEGCDSLEFLGV